MERYARQTVYHHIGKEGQKKLLHARVTIIGMGALGTVAANNLCRSGVGFLRMIDRDYVELSNLQRQILYDETDVKASLPKVIAATNHLKAINSDIHFEPVIADVNSANIGDFIKDVDLVLDATDNLPIRLLINESCIKFHIPWIYCAALGSEGMTLNILPDSNGPCLRCFIDETKSTEQTCSSYGVLNMTTNIMASLQTSEALKILLTSDEIRKELLCVDLWENTFQLIPLQKNEHCPVCVEHKYKLLEQMPGAYTTSLCGTDSIQVIPAGNRKIDLAIFAERLKKIGTVHLTPYSLTFIDNRYEIHLFQDGRSIIKHVLDENQAKSVYTEYIGLAIAN
ncbi:MAG: ThiF family adenylyltransferase [Lachnospiraceae bacterium]|nr:ThiF family adenylyltransferase [Lachnospiraceae bacterium]